MTWRDAKEKKSQSREIDDNVTVHLVAEDELAKEDGYEGQVGELAKQAHLQSQPSYRHHVGSKLRI